MHVDGEESPIVTCIGCQKKFCFKHKIAWHDNLGCDEYDQFLANPRGFKSRLDLENERVERERIEEQERLKREEEASRAYLQKLLEGEELEKARRQAEVERVAQAERERQERVRQENKARRAEEARHKLEKEALQRQKNEEENLRTIERTTKNCPSCSWPIEKNNGCAHMTCKSASFETPFFLFALRHG
jgi:flagellar biosynthesis GTPase FlhF